MKNVRGEVENIRDMDEEKMKKMRSERCNAEVCFSKNPSNFSYLYWRRTGIGRGK
jgi:hypothetical protein